MEGLVGGITRVLNGEGDWHEYTGIDVWTGFDGQNGLTPPSQA